MGELSEADKKLLLGANYKTDERRRDGQLHATSAPASMSGSLQSAFAFVAVVAFLIFIGDYFRPAAGRNNSLEVAALIVFALSAISFICARRLNLRKGYAQR